MKTQNMQETRAAQRPRYRLFADGDWTEYRVYRGESLLAGGVVPTKRAAIELARQVIERLMESR